MDDLTFFCRRTMQPLPYDSEDECAIIEQFEEKWFVRVARVSVRPYVKVGDKHLELLWDAQTQGYALPEPRENEKPLRELRQQIDGAAGLLWLFTTQIDGGERALTPPLYVGPGSLTEEEYSAILKRLGQIAVSLEGVALAPVLGPQANAASRNAKVTPNVTDRLIESADAFLQLFTAFESNWSLISSSPSRQMTLAPTLVDSVRPGAISSARAVQRCTQRPDLRRHEILVPQVSDDTPENRFVRFAIKTVLVDKAIPLASSLRNRSAWLRRAGSQPPTQAGRRYANLWRQGRAITEQTASQLEELAGRVEATIRQAEQWLQETFLADLAGPVTDQGLLTPRLTNSKEYGPVYRAFTDYKVARPSESVEINGSIFWALQERLVYPSWRLYELWAFVETYAMLVDQFGFRPLGQTPLDRMRLVGEDAILAEGERFELEFVPVNAEEASSRRLHALLEYGPKLPPHPCLGNKHCFDARVCPRLHCYKAIQGNGDWSRSKLTPDIFLQLETADGNVLEKFVMDAKYRRYDKQQSIKDKDRTKYGVDNRFDLDLLGIAKMKYRDALPCAAAFIIHSDPDPGYTTLGNDRLSVAPLRERNLGMTEWWPGHRIGAVYAGPGHLVNLEQVIRCFLMYHAGIVDVCWRCRKILTEGNGGLTHPPDWQGNYYQCTDCGNFWIVQVCQNRGDHHTLIKLGRESFHKTLPGKDWQCVCPVCGDAPSWKTDGPWKTTPAAVA